MTHNLEHFMSSIEKKVTEIMELCALSGFETNVEKHSAFLLKFAEREFKNQIRVLSENNKISPAEYSRIEKTKSESNISPFVQIRAKSPLRIASPR